MERHTTHPTPKPIVVPFVVRVIVVAVRRARVVFIVVKGAAPQHPTAFSGPPRRPKTAWLL